MYFLKISDKTYPAEFAGRVVDKDWDNRETKTITLNDMTLQEVEAILYDDVEWHIYQPMTAKEQALDENGKPIFVEQPMKDENGDLVYDEEENVVYEQVPVFIDVDVSEDYDNSAFSIRGPITLYPDGRISVKMGKPTDLEEAYELLYGGLE